MRTTFNKLPLVSFYFFDKNFINYLKHFIYLVTQPFYFFVGDEILAINGKSLQGMSHDEAINEFRAIKHGPVILRVARRDPAFNLDQDPLVLVKE